MSPQTYGNPQITLAAGGSVQGLDPAAPSPIGSFAAAMLVARTPPGGYTLVGSITPIYRVTPPNDGLEHLYAVQGIVNVTSAQTGGQIRVSYYIAGTPQNVVLDAGAHAAGQYPFTTSLFMADASVPGPSIVLSQNQPLTAGAAVLYAQIAQLT